MRENVSPEEKLLRLIRGKKKEPVVAEVKPTIKPSIYPLIQKYLYLFDIHKIIWAGFVVSCIYLVISLIYPFVGLKKIKLPKITPEKISQPKEEPKTEVKPFEFYQEGMSNKQIFGGVFGQGTAQPMTAVDVDLMKDINLVGIISGENPVGVIEDKKTKKTYYVTKGQFIGEMQVEDIQEGKIIVNYRGQKYELYL